MFCPYLYLSSKEVLLLNFDMRQTYVKRRLLLAFGLGLRQTLIVTGSQNKDIYLNVRSVLKVT